MSGAASRNESSVETRRKFFVQAHESLNDTELCRLCEERSTDFIATPFQRDSFLKPFYRHLPENCTPVIVTVAEQPSGRLAMVLPLLQRAGTMRSIEAADLGLSDYVSPSVASWFEPSSEEMGRIWKKLRSALPQADVLTLKKIPPQLNGRKKNPLMLLSQMAEMGTGTKVLALDNIESREHFRRAGIYKDAMRKLRKLKKLGEVEFRVAETREDALTQFEHLVAQRLDRFKALDRPDPLTNPNVRGLYREMIANGVETGEVLFGGLYLEGKCIATETGLIHGDTHHSILTTMKGGADLERFSPGIIAFMLILDETIERGIPYFDVGVGEFHYKSRLAGNEIPLYEHHEALSVRGQVALADATARRLVRRGLARYPALRAPVDNVRQRLRRLQRWIAAATVGVLNWEIFHTGLYVIETV